MFSCVSCRHVSFEGNCLSNVTRAGELRQHSAFECHLSYFSLSSESPQKRRVSSHGSLQVRRFKKKVVYAHLLETRHLNRVGRKSLSCSTAKELIGYSIWAGAHHTQYGRPSVSSFIAEQHAQLPLEARSTVMQTRCSELEEEVSAFSGPAKKK